MDSSHDQINNDHQGQANLAIDIVLFPEPRGGEPWSRFELPFGSFGADLTFGSCWSILVAAANKDSVG
ncbi:hypothetical protein IFM47457_06885 [Aspergillus lentulus]|nr:hypothetical protein IFM47457_06885 [Aspergillus lentulus]